MTTASRKTVREIDPIDERVARNEAGIDTLRAGLTEVSHSVHTLSRDMAEGFERLREANMRDRDQRYRDAKTPWGVIGTFIGVSVTVVLGIVGMVQGTNAATQGRLEKLIQANTANVEKVSDRIYDHEAKPGHEGSLGMQRNTERELDLAREVNRLQGSQLLEIMSSRFTHEDASIVTSKADKNAKRIEAILATIELMRDESRAHFQAIRGSP